MVRENPLSFVENRGAFWVSMRASGAPEWPERGLDEIARQIADTIMREVPEAFWDDDHTQSYWITKSLKNSGFEETLTKVDVTYLKLAVANECEHRLRPQTPMMAPVHTCGQCGGEIPEEFYTFTGRTGYSCGVCKLWFCGLKCAQEHGKSCKMKGLYTPMKAPVGPLDTCGICGDKTDIGEYCNTCHKCLCIHHRIFCMSCGKVFCENHLRPLRNIYGVQTPTCRTCYNERMSPMMAPDDPLPEGMLCTNECGIRNHGEGKKAVSKCSFCGEPFCETCGGPCERCHELFCDNHRYPVRDGKARCFECRFRASTTPMLAPVAEEAKKYSWYGKGLKEVKEILDDPEKYSIYTDDPNDTEGEWEYEQLRIYYNELKEKAKKTPMLAPPTCAYCGKPLEMDKVLECVRCKAKFCSKECGQAHIKEKHMQSHHECPVCGRHWSYLRFYCVNCCEREMPDKEHRDMKHYMICLGCARRMSPTLRKKSGKTYVKDKIHHELVEAGVLDYYRQRTPMKAPDDPPATCTRCGEDASYYCNECSVPRCDMCVKICHGCDRGFCDEHAPERGTMGDFLCKDCYKAKQTPMLAPDDNCGVYANCHEPAIDKCTLCNTPFSHGCGKYCKRCSKPFCDGHLVSRRGDWVCFECNMAPSTPMLAPAEPELCVCENDAKYHCGRCGKPLCDGCAKVCRYCDGYFCEDHLEGELGDVICEDCSCARSEAEEMEADWAESRMDEEPDDEEPDRPQTPMLAPRPDLITTLNHYMDTVYQKGVTVDVLRKSHRIAEKTFCDIIDYAGGKEVSDEKIQKALHWQNYELNFSEYKDMDELRKSTCADTKAFHALLEALGYGFRDGEAYKVRPMTPMLAPKGGIVRKPGVMGAVDKYIENVYSEKMHLRTFPRVWTVDDFKKSELASERTFCDIVDYASGLDIPEERLKKALEEQRFEFAFSGYDWGPNGPMPPDKNTKAYVNLVKALGFDIVDGKICKVNPKTPMLAPDDIVRGDIVRKADIIDYIKREIEKCESDSEYAGSNESRGNWHWIFNNLRNHFGYDADKDGNSIFGCGDDIKIYEYILQEIIPRVKGSAPSTPMLSPEDDK